MYGSWAKDLEMYIPLTIYISAVRQRNIYASSKNILESMDVRVVEYFIYYDATRNKGDGKGTRLRRIHFIILCTDILAAYIYIYIEYVYVIFDNI